jgi:predicted lysophospholipase L1 biosynthesis ABC-type transport system permease subunit
MGSAAVLASLTFAASLSQLVSTPRAYGWDFDAVVSSGDLTVEEEVRLATRMPEVLDQLPDVTGWSTLSVAQVRLGDRVEPVLTIDAHGDGPAHPTVLKGDIPNEPTELAAGVRTLERNGWDLGDEVTVGDGTFRVVGEVVLPGLSSYDASDEAALGGGLLVTGAGLTRAVPQGSPGGTVWAAALGPGVEAAHLAASLDRDLGPQVAQVAGPERPSDIEALAGARSTPLVLAAVLGLLAVSVLLQALLASVRRHRRDLAVLRSLGFTRRQVVASVAWHSSLVVAAGLAAGVPVGLLVGRSLWSRVAAELGVLDDWVLPTAALLAATVLILALANLTAAWPAVRAARARPVDILRTE